MKVLHTKLFHETILLVSSCPNMNLFAMVTPTRLLIYRSTTLTVLATFVICAPINDNNNASINKAHIVSHLKNNSNHSSCVNKMTMQAC